MNDQQLFEELETNAIIIEFLNNMLEDFCFIENAEETEKTVQFGEFTDATSQKYRVSFSGLKHNNGVLKRISVGINKLDKKIRNINIKIS